MKYKNIHIILLLIVIISSKTLAQWVSDPSINTPVCIWNSYQQIPEIVSDNRGGAIITWVDGRLGGSNIFIQRLDAQGYIQWGESGKPVCPFSGIQYPPNIIKDGEGGCILVWEDNRNGNSDIYAQRVDSSGNVLWDTSAVAICTRTLDQEDPQIISDGSGGAIIMWEFKQGAAGETGLYAQRINSNGQILWAVDGVPIATSPFPDPAQLKPKITSDGTGGIIIAWSDFSTAAYPNIFAQRVNGSGNILWSQNGIQVRTSNFDKRFQDITNVGSGEFILIWNESIPIDDWDLRAQKIDTSGNIHWNSEGVVICSNSVSINPSAITFDNFNSVIIGWEDHRIPGIGATIYCQKLELDGNNLWQQNGISVSSLNGMQGFVQLICATNGNTTVCWLDARINPSWDIYAQKFDGAGNRLWEGEGREVSTANSYKFPNNLIITGFEDYIVTWSDDRNGDPDIYTQSLNALITTVDELSKNYLSNFILLRNYPNPFNPSTKITWQSPLGSWQTLKIYDVLGNEVSTLVDEYKPAGTYEVTWYAKNLPSGVYFYQLKAGEFTSTKKMLLIK